MKAPELHASQWFNTASPMTLASLRGKVVILEAFQMLCPGCVSHGLPLTQRIHQAFDPDDIAVIGLHSVFEHHEAMTPTALEAFLYEYRIAFPVAVDQHDDTGTLPLTMRAYAMRGTPTTVVIDTHGAVRQQTFGNVSELKLGALIGSLLADRHAGSQTRCGEDGCTV